MSSYFRFLGVDRAFYLVRFLELGMTLLNQTPDGIKPVWRFASEDDIFG